MSPRRQGSIFRRLFLLALLLLAAVAGGVAWLVLRPPPVDDRTERCRAADVRLAAWAARRRLKFDESAARETAREETGVRWTSLERAFWYSPRQGRLVLRAELVRLGESLGLSARAAPSPGTDVAVEFAFPDGRPVLRVELKVACFAAVCIDDLGFNLKTARRVVALPCKLTCAIIPFTPYAKQVAAMAAANGKEVIIHMPMQSPFQVPDVPEYRIMLRVGMTPEEVDKDIRLALEDVPHAVGMNNHEGSKATEDRGLMDAVMNVLKPMNFFFLDSGTTEKTVAWMAARDAGLRWGRRNVFLDADRRTVEGVDAEFTKLLQLARRRGQALAIGHHQFPATLDVLERRIPEAQAKGVRFVYASAVMKP